MTSELGRRVWFTIGALLVFRLGTYIPLPGIDQAALAQLFRSQAGGLLGQADLFSGGAVGRLAIFALGLMPYLSAAILLQLVSIVVPGLAALPNQGEGGRRRLENYTLGLTFAFAAFQAFGIAVALESIPNFVVFESGVLFRITTVLSLTGGTIFLVWLSGQITARGIGNGLALIFFLGVVLELPGAVAATLEVGRMGALSSNIILGVLLLAVLLTGLIVFTELARRRLPVEYPRRQVGMRMIEGRSHLSVKLNAAGVIPAIVAAWLLAQVLATSNFFVGQGPGWGHAVADQLAHGRPLHMVVYALATVLCALFYTAFVLNPERVAADLEKRGGVIPGVAPGEPTAEHIDTAMSRTAMLGAVYLALVCLIPEMLVAYARVPFYLGGTSLLIVVCTVLDLDAQLKNGAHIRLGGQRP
jgi:preprotein translocase subunit SecY